MELKEINQRIDNLAEQENLLILLFYKMTDSDEYKKRISDEKDEKLVDKCKHTNFRVVYQSWYSKAMLLMKMILPERYNEFVNLYKPRDDREEIKISNYTIYDSMEGIHQTKGPMNANWGFTKLRNQISIIASLKDIVNERFNELTTIFEADLVEKEIDCCNVLFKNKFYRPAGSLAGVLLERYLKVKCTDNGIIISKKDPCINDYNTELYKNKIFNSSQFKFVGYLADIRNKCDHDKDLEPTKEEVGDLISGLKRVLSLY